MNLIYTAFFVFFTFFIGLLPFRLMYFFSDFMYLLTFYVFRYRKKVVVKNLVETFPTAEPKELSRITTKFYKNLIDIMIEGIKSFTMTRNQVKKRHKILNPEILKPYFNSGQSVIGVAGHYCNWEWGSLSASLQLEYNIVAFYKPLTNPFIDRFLRWSRSRFGTTLASIRDTTKTFQDLKSTPTIFLMAADQSPSNIEMAYQFDFLNRKTAFLHGPEKHARINNYPVFFVEVQRIKRGYYTIQLSLMVQNPSEYENGEITKIYAQKLESVILRKPEDWLWSHRRWKHTL